MPNAGQGIEQGSQHPVNVFVDAQRYGNNQAGINGFANKGAQDNFDATKYVSGPLGASRPTGTDAMDTQLNGYAFLKKSIIDLYKYRTFQNISATREMPKFSGTTMKMYRYMPIIDDRNINDQGIDANGIAIADGNLYGSSRDPGVITAKMPWGREGGGRINRTGFTRQEISAELSKVQFFWEYTEDMLAFDSDAEFYMHCVELSGEAMNKIVEDYLQIELQSTNNAIFGGGKAADAELDATSVLSYDLFNKLHLMATQNKIPSTMRIIKGSKKTDTKVVPAARVLYVPSELIPTLDSLQDSHGNPAFVGSEHYADAAKLMDNEIGKVGRFRIIEVEDAVLGVAGAANATDDFYKTASGNYQVFNLLLVGSEAFQAMTMHSMGSSGKKFGWRVIAKKPGSAVADRHDPYGESGFWSTRLYLGFLKLREERIIRVGVTAKI